MTTHHSLYSQIPLPTVCFATPHSCCCERFGHTATVEMLRLLQDEARCAIQAENALPDWCAAWEQEVEQRLDEKAQSALRPVINLTGTVLHTNLGRAQQAEEAVAAVRRRCARR
jgi:L-seryl-tRNA(Ser) seleniumtransferase